MKLRLSHYLSDSRERKTYRAGFSLVEMLVVISIIGVIAAIAVPSITNITGQTRTNVAKRNAQQFCGMYQAASASGASFTGVTKIELTDELIVGLTGQYNGGTVFRVPLTDAARDDALEYITFADGTLIYSPEGAVEGVAPPPPVPVFVTKFNNEPEAHFRAAEFQGNAPAGRTYVVIKESGSNEWGIYYEEA